MPSRKNLLKQISPYRGTGRYLQYVRCPTCGKLARGLALGNAGTHQLTVSQCVGPRPGYRAGFEWRHDSPSREHLEALKESLERALAQVNGALGEEAAVIPSQLIDDSDWWVGPGVESSEEWVLPPGTFRVEVISNGDYENETEEVIRPKGVRLDHV